MSTLIELLIGVGAGIIILLINTRFSPDPLVTQLVQWVVYIAMIIFVITRLYPLIR